MSSIRARVPMSFFRSLYPFNAKLIDGNGMKIQAIAAQEKDGSILRSKSYLLFGNGLATMLLPSNETANLGNTVYIMDFFQKTDVRQVPYWEVQSARDQGPLVSTDWELRVSYTEPDPDDGHQIKMLLEQTGSGGQYFYLVYKM